MKRLLSISFILIAVALSGVAQDYPDLYLRGACNGWSAPEDYKFQRNGNTYSITLGRLDGEFKIATSDWGGIEYGGASSGNGEITVEAGKNYTMRFANGRNYNCRGIDNVTLSFDYIPDVDLVLNVSSVSQPLRPTYSGTLPVMYINVYTDEDHTSLNNEIISYDLSHKNYFKHAEYYLDINGCKWLQELGAENIGSAEDPLPLQIKARGNWTRKGFSKKPFKLKLDSKQKLLGLTKSKHFALLGHADDNRGYLKNFTGFNLGKRIGLPWTPQAQPVEVVINGDYRGLYFLTESIRVEGGRVDITELDDLTDDPTLCSGGYLVELDNYDEDNQIRMEEKTAVGGYTDVLRITFDTPEEYSELQKRFIFDQFTAMNDAVGAASDNLWAYMDLDDAVRYYLVEEMISHVEAYHGSTYLFRDRGSEQKWHFSPLWDCGNAFNGPTDDYFYKHAPFGCTWIASMATNWKFRQKVEETWKWFMANKFEGLYEDINEYVSHISQAAISDRKRWMNQPVPEGGQEVADNTNMELRKQTVKTHIAEKIRYLERQFGSYSGNYAEPLRDATPSASLPEYLQSGVENISGNQSESSEKYYDLTGRPISYPSKGNIYILKSSKDARLIKF